MSPSWVGSKDASKCLAGIEPQPVTIESEGDNIPGYELRLRWIDIADPDERQTGDPWLVDEDSLLSLIDHLRVQIRLVQQEQQRPSGKPH